MNKPHKHADVIKAWADGAEIEVREPYCTEWSITEAPIWLADREYRVKPKPVIQKKFIYAEHFEALSTDKISAQLWNAGENSIKRPIIQVTLTDGKVTAVELTV